VGNALPRGTARALHSRSAGPRRVGSATIMCMVHTVSVSRERAKCASERVDVGTIAVSAGEPAIVKKQRGQIHLVYNDAMAPGVNIQEGAWSRTIFRHSRLSRLDEDPPKINIQFLAAATG